MHKILVTGGAGFIGSNLIKELKKLDFEIVSLDKRRQKIITDEYSGRILVDPKLAEEEMDKMKSIFS